jgi:hypothetical protein
MRLRFEPNLDFPLQAAEAVRDLLRPMLASFLSFRSGLKE